MAVAACDAVGSPFDVFRSGNRVEQISHDLLVHEGQQAFDQSGGAVFAHPNAVLRQIKCDIKAVWGTGGFGG